MRRNAAGCWPTGTRRRRPHPMTPTGSRRAPVTAAASTSARSSTCLPLAGRPATNGAATARLGLHGLCLKAERGEVDHGRLPGRHPDRPSRRSGPPARPPSPGRATRRLARPW
jgi:hypothetical protein